MTRGSADAEATFPSTKVAGVFFRSQLVGMFNQIEKAAAVQRVSGDEKDAAERGCVSPSELRRSALVGEVAEWLKAAVC